MSTLVEELNSRLESIKRRAAACGSNMTQVCKNTGVARVTYERWVNRAPTCLYKVDEMEREVERLEGVSK